MTSGRPSLFEYDNYRVFLRDTLSALKAKDKKFSLRFFARAAGFNSHNTLWNVIKSRNNLSENSIEKVAKALKFNREETHYFRHLVLLNQSKNSEEKTKYSQEIVRSKAYRRAHPLDESQLRYYTFWYMVVIREMVGLSHFQEDPEWIAQNVSPPITAKQAKEALIELQKLNLIARDEEGKWVQTNNIVETPNEVTSALVAQYHREFMKKASEAIDLVAREYRDISSVTFPVSLPTAQMLKEKIQAFRRELLAMAALDPNPATVYQMNFQLFPMSQLVDEKKQGGSGK